MEKYVHSYLKQHKIWQHAWKVIQLLKLELHKTKERVLKKKTFFLTCMAYTVVVAMLANLFLGIALS